MKFVPVLAECSIWVQSLQWPCRIDSPGYCPQNCRIMDPFDETSPFFLLPYIQYRREIDFVAFTKLFLPANDVSIWCCFWWISNGAILHRCSVYFSMVFRERHFFPFSLCLCLTTGRQFLSLPFLEKTMETMYVCLWIFHFWVEAFF